MSASAHDRTIASVLSAQAERLGDKPLLRFARTEEFLSYGRLVEMAECGSTRLRNEFAIDQGGAGAVFLPNGPAFTTASFTCLFGGMVDVPISHELKKRTLRFALATAAAVVVFTDADGFARLMEEEVADYLPRLSLIVLSDAATVAGATKSLAAKSIRLPVMSLQELTRPGPQAHLWTRVRGVELAAIRYSSGTTGAPKGVMCSHLFMLQASANHNAVMGYEASDILYSPLPLHHSLAGMMGFIGTIQVGGTMVSALRFSASQYWRDAASSGATLGHILFPLLPMLLAQPPGESDRAHKVRHLWTAWPHHEFETRFNTSLVQMYGMTEIGIVAGRVGGPDEASRCVGVPLPQMEVRIVDEQGQPVPVGGEGQITVRPRDANDVMLGYYNNFPATVAAFFNLWLNTGDRGHLDGKGQLYFLGRLGDTIRRRGVNISAEQIDEDILLHPDVRECAAVGVPSALGEEDIKVFVAWRQTPADLDAAMTGLLAFMDEQLPKEYVPRFIEIVDALPRTNTGKARKAELRQGGLGGALWDREQGRWAQPKACDA